ncbi:MAG: restriction endonuclease [Acidimicrobiia bacterium]|nr:restriction endonuclease [Acidimicrobiia bacterium]MYC57747.1 restriction endonuclease [Acidimicrobiia bacterium]MYI31296.1 restriction endonuclease [Acidimicrobiia bacterium]
MPNPLNLDGLKATAIEFANSLRCIPIIELFGTTDGKALGTWIEDSFNKFLAKRYAYEPGNAAHGIDFPELKVDLKATFLRQPQSSCPFRDASQKIFGLGYGLLVFVYEKTDTHETQSAAIDVRHALFIDRSRTSDYQTTKGILEILNRGGNVDDLVAFMEDRNLPLDEIGRTALAERVLSEPPKQGYITISNALQWRLQYGHAITNAGGVDGVQDLIS